MKRAPALIPLSREHHQLLLLAQLIKKKAPPYKGLPQDLEGKMEYLLEKNTRLLAPHMHLEEQTLFPFILSHTQDLEPEVEGLKAEHEQLKGLIAGVRSSDEPIELLDEIGHLLESHIRKEERSLFQKIQAQLSEEQMLELAALIIPPNNDHS